MDCLDKLEVQQEALEMQQLQMQVHIAALPVDEKRDEEQKKQLAELESHFFPYQTNEELNRYLTDVFVSEGMIMQDSTLRAGQLDEITPYSLSERMALLKKNEQAKQTQTGINASADSKKDEIDTKTEYVYSAQADYTAIGTKNQALAVLDKLSEKEKEDAENHYQLMLKLKSEIESKSINIFLQVGGDGKLFSHITTKRIADEFAAQTGITIDKRKISLPAEINSVGIFTAIVDLGKNVQATIEMNVLEK